MWNFVLRRLPISVYSLVSFNEAKCSQISSTGGQLQPFLRSIDVDPVSTQTPSTVSTSKQPFISYIILLPRGADFFLAAVLRHFGLMGHMGEL